MGDVVNAADAGMSDAAGELDLPLETEKDARVGGHLRTDDLQRPPPVQLFVFGLEDLSHPPGAEEPDDSIAAGDDIARRERSRRHLRLDEPAGPLVRGKQ